MPENHKPPSPAQPRHFELLGMIASLWAGLELLIDSTTWLLAKTPKETGACITSNIISIHAKIDCLIALCHHRKATQKTLRDLNKFQLKIRGTAGKRNRAIHDPWSIEESTDGSLVLSQITITAKGKPQFNTHEVPIEELYATYREINGRVKEFEKIVSQILDQSLA